MGGRVPSSEEKWNLIWQPSLFLLLRRFLIAAEKKICYRLWIFFNIRVVREATKQEEFYVKLVEAGILAEGSDDNDVEKPQDAVAETSAPVVFSEPELVQPYNPMLEIRFRELDLEIKRQECEAQMIRLRVIEAEKYCDIQLRKLDLEAHALMKKPVPVPCSQPPSITASPDNSVPPPSVSAFDISKYVKLVPPFREAEVDAYFVAFERIIFLKKKKNLYCSITCLHSSLTMFLLFPLLFCTFL